LGRNKQGRRKGRTSESTEKKFRRGTITKTKASGAKGISCRKKKG